MGGGGVPDVYAFGVAVGVVGAAGVLAVVAVRVGRWVPVPAVFLVGAAVAGVWLPGLSVRDVQRVVTVALVVLLFDGGMGIGRGRFRTVAGAVLWIGTAGTVVTAGAVAGLAHWLFGFGWAAALLIGTAVAPTDPAVVFSVLGRREVLGRSGVLLEGESGANDPVGIALMAGLVAALGGTGSAAGAAGRVAVDFAVQLAVGGAVGVVGGMALLAFMRRVALPAEGLYPLRALAGAAVLYGVATVAHGSGFLAVFAAGIVVGDGPAPYHGEVRRFHASLASLAEIVAFVVLGLSVSLPDLTAGHAAWIGLALAGLLAVLVRPVLVGLLLAPVRLRRGERVFVLWAGLKGAVPILLGTFVLSAGVADGPRLYAIVVVVVAFSVIVQGGLVPAVAGWCRVPMGAAGRTPSQPKPERAIDTQTPFS
jgi:potassium/hydrogen antiporter